MVIELHLSFYMDSNKKDDISHSNLVTFTNKSYFSGFGKCLI